MLPMAIGAIFSVMSELQLGIGSAVELYRTIRKHAPQGMVYPDLSDREVVALLKSHAERGIDKWTSELDRIPEEKAEEEDR